MLCVTNLLLHGLDVPRVYHANSLLRDVLDYTEADKVDVVLMNPPYGGSEKADVKNHFPDDLANAKPLVARLFLPLLRNKGHEKSGVPVLPCGSGKRRLCGAI